MAFVVDASVAGAWLLPDERSEESEALIRLVYWEEAFAPLIWQFEAANLVASAKHGGRVTREDATLAIEDLLRLRVNLVESRMMDVFNLADRFSLSIYDAAYLALAIRKRAALATFDRKLAEAAKAMSVLLLL